MKAIIGTDREEAAKLLAGGGLVAIPTETVYGLAANAFSPAAVAKIFEAKKRPYFDPLIIHIPNYEVLSRYAQEIPETAIKLAKAFWPGPLTLVLEKKSVIPDIVTSGLTTAGFRVPAHDMTIGLLEHLPFPVAAPSANPFGYISPTSPQHVAEQLGEEIDYILDGGICKVGIESTIVGFDGETPVIYRLGGIEAERIEAIAGKVEINTSLNANPASPGQLDVHYAPTKPLYRGNIDELIKQYPNKKFGIISLEQPYKHKHIIKNWVLSREGSLHEAAAQLFSAMREADNSAADIILAEYFPDEGLGKAINDRLMRASAKPAHS